MPNITDQPLAAPPGLAVRAAIALRKAMLRAADACVPAQFAAFERVTAAAGSHILAELARLGVPDLLEEKPLTGAEIALRTKTDADAMQRVMRAAVTIGVFQRRLSGPRLER